MERKPVVGSADLSIQQHITMGSTLFNTQSKCKHNSSRHTWQWILANRRVYFIKYAIFLAITLSLNPNIMKSIIA